jgi:hypothetical protein
MNARERAAPAEIYKYPRTYHIVGSGLQRDDAPSDGVPFDALRGRHFVVEEKMDGANCAVSFNANGMLRLQSRGHYLTGGPRERQFALLKQWAQRFNQQMRRVLSDRYVMYGEWVYAKHTVFYTDLPHYFLEFDILDTVAGTFLSTSRRRELLSHMPFVASVRVLHEGTLPSAAALRDLIGPSAFIASDHIERLRAQCEKVGVDTERAVRETDNTGLMEGLYIKVEEHAEVVDRFKLVRRGFLQTVIDSESHWMDRPLVPNLLRASATLFEGNDQ